MQLPVATLATVALLAVAGSVSADDRHRHDDGDRSRTRLTGYMEVPAISTQAFGRFRANIDERTQEIHYRLSYRDLEGDVRQAHIHLGQKSVNGGVMVFLCQTEANPDPTGFAPVCPQSGTVEGILRPGNLVPAGIPAQGLDPLEPTGFEEMVAAIRAGVAYVNVHSTRFPGGEIRGQLLEDD